MVEPVTGQPWTTVPMEEDVINSLHEILMAAHKLRPDGEFSYSDVIRLLLKIMADTDYKPQWLAERLAREV